MHVDSWAFLVSRNKYLDYRSVIAPDFICEAKISHLLARVADGELTESGKAYIREIHDSKVGDFTIVFRVIKATEKDLNPDGETGILKDPFGREIFLIKGFVLDGIYDKTELLVTEQDIEDIHQTVRQGYSQFWEYSEPQPAIPSTKFSLNLDSLPSNDFFDLEELQPFNVNSRSSQPRNEENENYSIQTVKSARTAKPKMNLAAVIITGVLVLMLTGTLLTRAIFLRIFGANLSHACTTIQSDSIPIKADSKISSVLNKWKKNHPNKEIFLTGALEIQESRPSRRHFKLLNARKPPNQNKSEILYTLVGNGSLLEMNYHPFDLAIIQLGNHKVVKEANIEAKIISRKKCTD